ncbi:MAG: AAA family ATPase [candidate division Zixibacteria bacterium]|nr:AAA family ATPase [candidate division Zixibacteria bacterium]
MKIRRLEILRYKNIESFSAELSDGVNVISGLNESGKSTLVEALTDLLFTDPESTAKRLKENKSWNETQSFELSMDFETGSKRYRLKKNFDVGLTLLTNLESGEEIDNHRKIQSIINNSLGLANKDIYLATSTIRQDEIDLVSRSSDAIKDKLEGLITGGKEEVLASEALKKVEGRIQEIKKEGHKHLGVLQKLQKKKQEMIYELDKAKREIEIVTKNRAKLKETQSLLEGIRTEYQAKKSQMEKAARAAENEERRKNLEERYSDLNNRVKSIKSSDQLLAELKNEISKLPKIDEDDIRLVEEQSAQIRYLENKKSPIEQKAVDLAEKIEQAKPNVLVKVLALFFLAASVGMTTYFFAFAQMSDTRFLIGAGADFVIFLVTALIWFTKSRQVSALEINYQIKKDNLEEVITDYDNASATVRELLARYKASGVSDLKKKFEDYRDLEKEIKSEARRNETWLGGKTLVQLEEDLQRVTRDLAVENETARELRIYSMEAEDSEKLRMVVEALEKQKSNLEATELSLRRQLEFAESGCELQASLEERLEYIDEDIQRAKRILRVYELTHDFIEKSRKNVLKASLSRLEEQTSNLLSTVSGGKYQKVKFDPSNLSYEVFSAAKDDWIDPNLELSRGARDQLYLAARLALVQMISQEKKPLLIMDEPFLTFDHLRRREALEVLRVTGEDHQVFILSCHPYYDSVASKKLYLSQELQSAPESHTPVGV